MKSSARTGILATPHGVIKTPAFVACATKATLKSLSPEDIDSIGTQLLFVNTYHMVISPGIDILERAGGVHAFSKISKPIITDSGGFQVFSLGRQSSALWDEGGSGRDNDSPTLVRITDDGVEFRSHTDGQTYFFTPEFSINAQKKIGADLIVAFDECIYYGATRTYALRSLARTHDWAQRSLRASQFKISNLKFKIDQQIYGVIQGGMFEDLRHQSAQFISSLPFWGLAIGGVSVGETKQEMRDQTAWAMEVIQDDLRPKHILGIGEFDDIVDMVKMGVDTFDCVKPTRDARNGILYNNLKIGGNTIDILKAIYKSDLEPVDSTCDCYTCTKYSRAYLHHLFKQRELLAYRLATIHNLTFMEKLFADIREKIGKGLL